MADQAERVILEAEDQVTPITDKANAALDGFEKKAESSHGKVIRISDQTRSSVQRLIASLEKQAETYGKSGVEKLITQRDQLLQRYAREPQAIDAITKSYEKMIAIEEKAAREALAAKAAKEAEEALRKQSAAIKSLGDDVTQFMQNPLMGAQNAISRVTAAIGPFGVGLVAGAASLAAVGVAAFEAAKSLGEYGIRIKDAELRTGLAANEVEQFGFAARASGQDVSIFERMMRGLSQAADDTSKEGEKARGAMQRMGVTLYDATGAIKPTSQVLVEISEGLNRLPEGFQRDAAAMDLFKRAGIEAIPVITELSENLQIAKDHGYGPSEEEVRRFAGYQREVTELEVSWERLKRNLEVPLVASVNFLFDGLKWLDFIASMPGKMFASQFLSGKSTAMDTEMAETGGWGYGASMSRSAHRAEVRSIAANDAMVAAARVSDEKNQQLELAEKKLSELQGELKTGVFPSVNQPVLDQIAKERQVIAGLKADAEAKKAAAEATKKFSEELKEAVKHADELRDKLTTKLLTGIEQTHPINREVEPNAPGGIVGQMLYGQDVRLGQILHMNVIADRGAIRGCVIGSEDADLRALAPGRLDPQRNEMRLGIVRLADFGVLVSAGRIEVAQRRPAQTVSLAIPAKRLLDKELRLAVRIHRILRMQLIKRKAQRIAIGGAGRGEDDVTNSGGAHGIQKAQAVDDVVAKVFLRLSHRLADIGAGREMHDRVNLLLAQHTRHEIRISDISPHQRAPANRPFIAGAEVIDHDWKVPGARERLAGMTSDIAGAAGD